MPNISWKETANFIIINSCGIAMFQSLRKKKSRKEINITRWTKSKSLLFPVKQKQLLTNSKLHLKIFVSFINLNLVSVCEFESFFCFCMNISYILKTKQKISARIYTKLDFKSCLLIDKMWYKLSFHYWPHNSDQYWFLFICSLCFKIFTLVKWKTVNVKNEIMVNFRRL